MIRSARSTAAGWGIAGLWYRATGNADGLYSIWVRSQARDQAALDAERSHAQRPGHLLGLITHVAGASDWPDAQTVASVLQQTYARWEWTVVTSYAADTLPAAFSESLKESRIRVVRRPAGATRADAWNAAVNESAAAFVGVIDSGDALSPSALNDVADSLERDPHADVVYTDEDTMGAGGRRQRPQFKPAWSPELLLATNYVGRLCMIRRELLTGAGGFRNGFDGAEEWDLLLRLSRQSSNIRRVPQCLYHRSQNRQPASPDTGANAITDHCRENGLAATTSTSPFGCRSSWPLPHDCLVSVIVPSRNMFELISTCARGLLEGTRRPRLELIIVDNGSTDADVLSLYRSLQTGGRARVVACDGPFNFSAACNAGAAAARGELLLFLNNDIEVIDPGWLEELARWAMVPSIGVVGAKLLYPDRTIQHAGVVFGIGLVGHLFAHAAEGKTAGIFGSSETYRNCSAVTGACQMMRRSVFDEVGGFDERFRLSFSDVVFCIEARRRGYRVVYTPHARLVHHESFTRKREDSLEDLRRLVQYLKQHELYDDPYFHPELNPESPVPALRPPFAAAPNRVVKDYVNRVLAEAAVSR